MTASFIGDIMTEMDRSRKEIEFISLFKVYACVCQTLSVFDAFLHAFMAT